MFRFFLINLIALLGLCNNSCVKNKYQAYLKIQNQKNDILYGETLYPEQIKSQIDIYNKKYNLNIKYANDKNDFENFVKNLKIKDVPSAIFQYNEGHKYGFIFVKYQGQDYCLAIDTIPTLSEYTKQLNLKKDNNLYIKFNGKEYRVVMFGENLQKAMKGCGSFTLVFLKHLLKDNGKMLFEVLKLEQKYGTGDKTQRDKNRKSCIRGVDFEIIKKQDFAKDIYKYAQSMELQKNFDNAIFEKNNMKYSQYRNDFSILKQNKEGKEIQISTKIFDITQKYKLSPFIKKQSDDIETNKNNEDDFFKNGIVVLYHPQAALPYKVITNIDDQSKFKLKAVPALYYQPHYLQYYRMKRDLSAG